MEADAKKKRRLQETQRQVRKNVRGTANCVRDDEMAATRQRIESDVEQAFQSNVRTRKGFIGAHRLAGLMQQLQEPLVPGEEDPVLNKLADERGGISWEKVRIRCVCLCRISSDSPPSFWFIFQG